MEFGLDDLGFDLELEIGVHQDLRIHEEFDRQIFLKDWVFSSHS